MTLEADVRRYLHDVLGLPTQDAEPWTRAGELPYFLRDTFRFRELVLLGQTVVLALTRSEQRQSLSEVRQWLDKVQAVSRCPVVYGTEALASYERKRLIEQKVAFVVPGNQLYLPDLGLDLREYFRQRASRAEGTLSPSAQALLIAALLRQPWRFEWQPSSIGSALGYTAMTVSRVVRELTTAGLATSYSVGRTRWLRMEASPQQTWERAKPMLRTPVRRTVWVSGSGVAMGALRLAGLSALAQHSMLAHPKTPVYALGPTEWKAARKAGVRALPEASPGGHAWQIWAYSPALVPHQATVDPLSLRLSVEVDMDDRVRLALDALKAQLPW